MGAEKRCLWRGDWKEKGAEKTVNLFAVSKWFQDFCETVSREQAKPALLAEISLRFTVTACCNELGIWISSGARCETAHLVLKVLPISEVLWRS